MFGKKNKLVKLNMNSISDGEHRIPSKDGTSWKTVNVYIDDKGNRCVSKKDKNLIIANQKRIKNMYR